MVCLDGNARHAIAHRIAQANKCRATMETCVEFPMAPQIVAVEHRKDYDVAGFPLELDCLDRRSRHRETKLRAGAREWWRMLLE